MDKSQPQHTGKPDLSDPHGRGAADVPPPHVPGPRDVAEGYEHRDVSLKSVVYSLLGLAVSVAVILVIVVWFNDAIDSYVKADQKDEYGTDDRPHFLPPEPRLQPSIGHPSLDKEDMVALRDEQVGKVEVDKETGREKLVGGLAGSGWVWNPRERQAEVTEELRDKVGRWLGSPATTQPGVTPVGTPPETAPAAPGAGTAPSAAQPPTTAPVAPTEPAAPVTTAPAATQPAETPPVPAKTAPEPAAHEAPPAQPKEIPSPAAPAPPESGEKL